MKQVHEYIHLFGDTPAFVANRVDFAVVRYHDQLLPPYFLELKKIVRARVGSGEGLAPDSCWGEACCACGSLVGRYWAHGLCGTRTKDSKTHRAVTSRAAHARW